MKSYFRYLPRQAAPRKKRHTEHGSSNFRLPQHPPPPLPESAHPLPRNPPAINTKTQRAEAGGRGRHRSARPEPQPRSHPGAVAEGLLKPPEGRLSPSPAPYLLLRRALRGVLRGPSHGKADSPPPSNTCVPGAGRRREGEGQRVAASLTLTQRPGGAKARSLPSRLGRGDSPREEPASGEGCTAESAEPPAGGRDPPSPSVPPCHFHCGEERGSSPSLSPAGAAAGAVREVNPRLCCTGSPLARPGAQRKAATAPAPPVPSEAPRAPTAAAPASPRGEALHGRGSGGEAFWVRFQTKPKNTGSRADARVSDLYEFITTPASYAVVSQPAMRFTQTRCSTQEPAAGRAAALHGPAS